MKNFLPHLLWSVLLAVFVSACGFETEGDQAADSDVESTSAEPLVVYSARQEHLIKPLFDRYTEMTGVRIDYITDSAGPLLTRLKAEGERTPADLLLTTDAGNLWHATQEGLLQPVHTDQLNKVPEHLRDPAGHWYGLSIRARTMVYASDRVDPAEMSSYEALSEPQWQGRLCLRTAKKVYNQSLVATLIASQGLDEAERVVAGWVANLGLNPFSNDTKVMEAILSGQCDVGIVNTYYFGRLKAKTPGAKLALFWPNQRGEAPLDRGVHINISGAGVTRHSQSVEEATQLVSWLSGEEAQQIFAALNQEYPIHSSVKVSEEVAKWGEFRADRVNLSVAGQLQADAIRLMDRVGYH
jgi:iron(III) transport system substrate-binding protein